VRGKGEGMKYKHRTVDDFTEEELREAGRRLSQFIQDAIKKCSESLEN
jgi:hypothetical protein